jgi:hypothetical protein
MAAFCECCGAEITLKAEACPVCGTPRHGMAPPPDSLAPADQLLSVPVAAGSPLPNRTSRNSACRLRR